MDWNFERQFLDTLRWEILTKDCFSLLGWSWVFAGSGHALRILIFFISLYRKIVPNDQPQTVWPSDSNWWVQWIHANTGASPIEPLIEPQIEHRLSDRAFNRASKKASNRVSKRLIKQLTKRSCQSVTGLCKKKNCHSQQFVINENSSIVRSHSATSRQSHSSHSV